VAAAADQTYSPVIMELSLFGIAIAFVAGVISFLSPCVLPLVPGYVSYIAGGSLEDLTENPTARHRLKAIYLSLFFILGFSIVFIALGASASAVGEFLLSNKRLFEYIAGAVIVLFGIYLMGLLRIPFLEREMRFVARSAGGHPASAILLGTAFAFGWTPCIGPVLGGILTMSANTSEIGAGVVLLAFYSLGLGLPFLAAAAFTGFFLNSMKSMRRIGRPFQIFAGAVMVAMGIGLLTGYLSTLAYWLLELAPGLATLDSALM
jgi:cytochrome c-type biogenesis protein